MDEKLDAAFHDTMASLYFFVYNSSNLMFVVLGASLYDTYGYQSTMKIAATF